MSGQQPGHVPANTPEGSRPADATSPQSPANPDNAAQAAQGSVYVGNTDPSAPSAPSAAGWGGPAQESAAGWGTPGTSNPRTPAATSWTGKRGLAVAAAAVVLAVGAGAGAIALTSNSAAADGTTAAGGLGQGAQGVGPGAGQAGQGAAQGGAAGGRQGQDGGGFSAAGIAGILAAVHAEYVILQDGAYVTQYEQTGTVTDVSTTAVTVESSDGFSRSYTLGGDVAVSNQQMMRQQAGGSTASPLSVADIDAGSTVRIVAESDGSDYAAKSVIVTTATAAQGN